MRHAKFAAVLLLAACGASTDQPAVDANNITATDANAMPPADNVDNELIDNPNGTQTLRLEGNDSATFVDGELVEVNRSE